MTHPRRTKPVECFTFTWRRRGKASALRWQRHTSDHTVLVGPAQESLRPYQPLVEETGLFMTFAHLTGSQNAFLRFANTYGRLGTYHSYGPERGEPLYEWQMHHRWMRFLTQLRSVTSEIPRSSAI